MRLDKPTTCFKRIPEWFVLRYAQGEDSEIVQWGRNFRKIGPIKKLILQEGIFADPSPNPEYGPQLMQVELLAEIIPERNMVIVSPLTERDEMLIAKHCEKMEKLKIDPRRRLWEPPKPWLPFMPDRLNQL
jgi:hypothetical protein